MECEKVTMSESNSNTQCDKRRQKMTEMAAFGAQRRERMHLLYQANKNIASVRGSDLTLQN